MDKGPLVNEELEAGARLLAEFEKRGFPIRIAFWLKNAETGNWRLYIASDRIDDDNFDSAIRELIRLAGHMKDPWFDPFKVAMRGSDDALVQAIMGIQKRKPGMIPMRIFDFHGAHTDAEEIYVYPQPVPVPA